MKLKGKVAIITGGSQGFGFAVAKSFIENGAHVMLCARNQQQLQSAHQELSVLAKDQCKVLTQVVDISKPNEVASLIKNTLNALGQIDILVSNAGVYGPKGPIEEVNWDEWSDAIDINLKGTVLLCREVLPHFKQKRSGKIILLSGGGATKPLPFLSAYAASKAAVVRFGETLAEEVKNEGIAVNAVAPGALNTRLLDEVLNAGPEKVGQAFYEQSLKQKENGGAPLEKGAALCVYLASDDSDAITGKLISAIWDPWLEFSDYLNELKSSDVYTLRRVELNKTR